MFNRPTFEKAFFRTMLQGWKRMGDEAKAIVREGVATAQGAAGLFCGRGNKEDLYYSFFGLLLSLMPGMKINRKACRHALASIDLSPLDLVHSCAFFRSLRILHPFTWRFKYDISSLRSLPPTAYPHGDPEAPYSRFLLDTLLNDCGEKTSRPDLHEYRLPDGLYSNLKNQTEYNVNATAAAAFLLSFILSVATPPVIGGTTVCFSILFTQLGLQSQALALIISVNAFFEFLTVAVNNYCLQSQIVLLGNSLGELDIKRFRS